MTIIAFDVSKLELVGARMRTNGRVAERYIVVKYSRRHQSFPRHIAEEKVMIGSEATAEYHLHLARACLARGIPFKLINPIITKQFTRATIRKRKTDRDDAEIIGKCLLQGAGRELSPHDLEPATRILRTASDLSMLAGSLHLKHKRFVDRFPETTIVQDGIAEAEDALRRVAQMLRTHGAGLVPHKERALADSVIGIGEDPFLNHRLGDRRPYAL